LLHPLSNLVASDQIRSGDLIQVDYSPATGTLNFTTEAEDVPAYEMAELIGGPSETRTAVAAAASSSKSNHSANAKSSRN
jgi:ATP-dependent Clp protease ATP-binding subunit ClpB